MAEAEVGTQQLAGQTGIDQSVIARILHAQRLPSAATLVALADRFQCSTDYLLGRTDLPGTQTFVPRPPFAGRMDALLHHFQTTKYRLERQTGISSETMRRWQRGRYEPTVENLVRLADHFGCSVDFILGREC